MKLPLLVLLVEDSEDDALLLIEALHRDGYEPEFERVESGPALRATLGTRDWDVVLCDYIMPRFDAPAALRIVQEFNPDLPVIVLSGTVGEDVAVATIKLGAEDYLMKDRLARLGQAVSQVLEQKRLRRERKQSEQALRESEQKFATIFREAPVWIVISRVDDGICLEVNDAALDASGFLRQEVIGRTGADLGWISAGDRELLVRKMREQGRVVDFEMMFRAKDGRELCGLVSCSPIVIGGRHCTLSVTIDITARRRAEMALKESTAQLQSILGVAPIGVARVSKRALLEVNGAMIQMLGYTREELYGKQTRMLYVTEEDYQAVGRQYAQLEKQNVASFETRFRARDGRVIDVAVNAVWLDSGNQGAGTVIAVMDISERKQAERALHESEEKFAKAFRASPDAISVSDLSTGCFLDVNEGYEKLSGYKHAQLIGRTSSELGIWSNPGDRERMLEELNRSGSVRDMQLQARTHSGELKSFLLSAEKVEIGGRPCVVVVSRDITVRLQSEQALRESEEKFSKAFRVSPHSLTISELATGRYLDVNSGFEKISGFVRAEVLGRTSAELGLWLTAADREELVRSLETDGFVRNRELTFCRRDGSRVTTLSSCELVEIGGTRCLLNTIEDITERRQAEQALRESEEKFSKAFRASPDAIAITDLETGLYIEANGGHEQIFGFTREEVIGRTTLELGYYRNPEDRARMVAEIRAHGVVHNLELPCLNRRGDLITVLYSGEAIEVNGRKCLVSVIRDITSRKRAEEALRDSEARFRSYFESPFIGMAITSADRRWLEVNDHLCRMLGYPREELLRMSWSEITVAEDVTKNDALLGRVMAGELDGCTFEKRYRRKDGGILYANLSTRSFRRSDGTLDYFLTVIQDITGKHEAEESRDRLEQQLRQAQKLEALGTLAGGIAHDFNNILTAMIVYRELAVMDIDRPADLRKHLAEIGQASTRAKELVRQILTFSRQQKQERRAVRLHPVVKEALQLLRSSLPSTIEMDLHIDEQSPEVLADTGQVHQIVMNLATNAAHAMRDLPGRLTVRLAPRQVDEEFCRIQSGLRPGLYAQLSVTDMGHGMDEATLSHIFEPFFTTKGPGEGTGLGLAVVHGIMEDHDGTIAVRSRVGEGTTFDLFFPRYLGILPAAAEPDASIPRGRGESVLLIDDELPLCDAIGAVLQKLGYRVTVYTNPKDAVARFASAPRGFDVVVTDHTMPHMTGLDVIREVHALRPGIPILLVSGLSSTWTPEKLRGFDIRELVAKPLDLASLAQAVRRALDRPLLMTD